MRSDSAKKGFERAPHRSLFYATGLTPEELDRPLIGVVNSFNEIVPGHAHLDKIAQAVKTGVRVAGGTPLEGSILESLPLARRKMLFCSLSQTMLPPPAFRVATILVSRVLRLVDQRLYPCSKRAR